MKTKIFLPQTMMELCEHDAGDVVTISGSWIESTEDFMPDEVYSVVLNEQYNTSRWNAQYNLVFLDKNNEKYYHCTYERGLTERNYTTPFCDEMDGIKCYEVSVRQVPVVTYKTEWDYL